MPSGSCVKNLNSSYRVFCLMFKSLRKMDKQRQTAGETATTNQFDAEIVRLKQERDARFREIDERIGRLMAQNANMNQLRQLNQEQIHILSREKDMLGKDYRSKVAEINSAKDAYYVDNYSHEHYKRFAAFCDLHPEVLAMWREFRLQEEGGAA